MSSDMFIKFDGVEGGSIDKVHKGEIDVFAWNWGLNNSSNPHVGTGSGKGKVDVHDLHFVKPVDMASTPLIAACATGKHYKEVVLLVRTSGGTPLDIFKITMTQVVVTAISMSHSSGESSLTENISISFASYHVVMQPQDENGGKNGGAIEAGFNIVENTRL